MEGSSAQRLLKIFETFSDKFSFRVMLFVSAEEMISKVSP